MQPVTDKRKKLDQLLAQEYVLLYIKTGAPGLIIPPHLYSQPVVTLKISRLFRGSLTLEDKKIVTELLFGSNYFVCEIPYDSIWGVSSSAGDSFMWPDSAPPEVDLKGLAERAEATAAAPAAAAAATGQSKAKDTFASAAKKKDRPNHLKLVK